MLGYRRAKPGSKKFPLKKRDRRSRRNRRVRSRGATKRRAKPGAPASCAPCSRVDAARQITLTARHWRARQVSSNRSRSHAATSHGPGYSCGTDNYGKGGHIHVRKRSPVHSHYASAWLVHGDCGKRSLSSVANGSRFPCFWHTSHRERHGRRKAAQSIMEVAVLLCERGCGFTLVPLVGSRRKIKAQKPGRALTRQITSSAEKRYKRRFLRLALWNHRDHEIDKISKNQKPMVGTLRSGQRCESRGCYRFHFAAAGVGRKQVSDDRAHGSL